MLFDLDGTLIDHETAADAAVDHLGVAYADVLGQISQAELRTRWRSLQDRWFTAYLQRRVTFEEQRLARVQGLWTELGHNPPSRSESTAIFGTYLAAYEAAWTLFPDVIPCLNRLNARRFGVITNGDRSQQLNKVSVCGIGDRFDVFVTSSEVGVAKPSPDLFREAARRTGSDPARCTYVGDRLDTDAVAATEAGMTGVWLDRGDDPRTPVPPSVIRITTLDALMS